MAKKISETKVREIVRRQLQLKKLNDLHESSLSETETTGKAQMQKGMSNADAFLALKDLALIMQKGAGLQRWQIAATVMLAQQLPGAFSEGGPSKDQFARGAKLMGIDLAQATPAEGTGE